MTVKPLENKAVDTKTKWEDQVALNEEPTTLPSIKRISPTHETEEKPSHKTKSGGYWVELNDSSNSQYTPTLSTREAFEKKFFPHKKSRVENPITDENSNKNFTNKITEEKTIQPTSTKSRY